MPDHSSLTRIRQRLGVDVFQRFFEHVVDLCQDAGLVWGHELFFDATNVEANAAVDSLLPRFYHDATAHVTGLFTDPPPRDDVVSPQGVVHVPASGLHTESTTAPKQPPRWKLLEERRLDPDRPAVGGYRRTSDFRVSPTDPDATPMRTGSDTNLGYHDHYVVDGGKHRVILAALVTPADVMENVPMRDLLWRVCFRRKLWPHHVIGDTTYGTVENIVAVEDAGIRAYMPLPDWGSRRPGIFSQGDFRYDAARDEYRCPQAHPLQRATAKYREGVVVYRANAATCNACPFKDRCTESRHGRIVHRSFSEEYLETVRSYHATEAYHQAMRKRQVWVEPLFAEAKAWHGLRQFRLRGAGERQYRGTVGGCWSEPQALPDGNRVGPA